MTEIRKAWLCTGLVIALLPAAGYKQEDNTAKPGARKPDAGDALQFLGSYSAPNVIVATETGHTSARPPSPPSEARLRDIARRRSLEPPWADAANRGQPGAVNRQAATVLWHDAMVAVQEGRTSDSRRLLAQLIELVPDNATVWFELGSAALGEARANSRRLGEIDPQGPWSRKLEADAVGVRYPELANRIRSQEAEETSKKPEARSQEAGSRKQDVRSQGHTDEEPPKPSELLRQMEGLPDSPEVLYRRVRADVELSKEAFGQAASDSRFDARLYALRALAMEDQNDEAAAIREYQAGLAEYPDSTLLHAGLGHVYRNRQDFRAARLELEKAWQLDATDPLVAFELGDVYRRMGDTQKAAEILTHALVLDPGSQLARWSRGRAYASLGDDERALADLEGAAPVDDTGELQFQLAGLYRKLGRTDLADRAQQVSEEQRAAKNRKQ